jgi:hypothetical protein
MKNKAYFVNRLAQLKGLDPASQEVQSWSDKKIIDLMIEIREARTEAAEAAAKAKADSDSDDDISIMRRVLKT